MNLVTLPLSCNVHVPPHSTQYCTLPRIIDTVYILRISYRQPTTVLDIILLISLCKTKTIIIIMDAI